MGFEITLRQHPNLPRRFRRSKKPIVAAWRLLLRRLCLPWNQCKNCSFKIIIIMMITIETKREEKAVLLQYYNSTISLTSKKGRNTERTRYRQTNYRKKRVVCFPGTYIYFLTTPCLPVFENIMMKMSGYIDKTWMHLPALLKHKTRLHYLRSSN